MNLIDKFAVITGATRGIGFAAAKLLATEGASVFICGRSRKSVNESVAQLSRFGRVEGEVCDVCSEDQVRLMIAEAERRFGGIDILINNAGIGYFGKTIEEMTGDEFRETLETNLFGVFYACHYAIGSMRRRGGGYIINISSLAGQNPHPKMAAYNASKFGLNGFSEALMQEVRHDNIKVSYICPGSVNTGFGNGQPDASNSWQLQPEDIAKVVIDLLTMPDRALASKIEIRPSKPPVK
ncbi:MAG: short-chain dehydrogenase [Blastocatellia bacterium]